MLKKVMEVCDYLLVLLILLPGSNPRSLNADQHQLGRKNETLEQAGDKSFPSLENFDNFVDGQCPPRGNAQDVAGECKEECSSDRDCTEDYKCCQDGCSMVCMEPWFPNKIVDWTKSTSLNQISSDLTSESWKTRGEPCSTSVLDGLQPLRCPTNHVCQILVEGDAQLNIPNRGECVRTDERKPATGITESANNQEFSTECSHKGRTYKHKEKFRKDCNICVCHNSVVFCDNRPCPVTKIGVPAAIFNYKIEERKQTTGCKYIRKDSELEDTQDASGSGGVAEDCSDQEGEVNADKRVSSGSGDRGDLDARPEVSSGDDEQAPQHEVNNDEEDVSGDDRSAPLRDASGNESTKNESIDAKNQSTSDDLGFTSESASVEIVTDEADRRKTTTTRETRTFQIFTLPWRRPTPTPETTTFAPSIKQKVIPSTAGVETEVNYSEITNTSNPEFEISKTRNTTEPPRLRQTAPTEDIIRLTGSDYEPSGERTENYSGDTKDELSGDYTSSGGSGEEPSTHATQVEPTYPDTIFLLKPSNRSIGSGFASIDVINDGPVKRSQNRETEEGSGDEGSTSKIIAGGNVGTGTGQTSEYLATTDDEN